MNYQKALLTRTKATLEEHTLVPNQSQAQRQAPTHPMLQLQQQIGNRAVGNIIQAKLKIGAVGDKYERQADTIATEVVQRLHSSHSQTVQWQEKEDENKLQMKSENPLKGDNQRIFQPLMATAESVPGEAVTPEFEASLNWAKAGGQPFSDDIGETMEQAFGVDFSGVRIHTDVQSDQLNQSIQAKAFTTGLHIFFRQGVYKPGSRSGQELIAHELTHVVQQRSDMVQRTPTPPGSVDAAVEDKETEWKTATNKLKQEIVTRVKAIKNKESEIKNKWFPLLEEKTKSLEEKYRNKDLVNLQKETNEVESLLDNIEHAEARDNVLVNDIQTFEKQEREKKPKEQNQARLKNLQEWRNKFIALTWDEIVNSFESDRQNYGFRYIESKMAEYRERDTEAKERDQTYKQQMEQNRKEGLVGDNGKILNLYTLDEIEKQRGQEEKTALADAIQALSNSTLHTWGGKWGETYGNYQRNLPAGDYKEYYVRKFPGTLGPGPRRLVQRDTNNKSTHFIYYSWTHYGDQGDPPFVRIK